VARAPVQERSKARVERIVEAAKQLLATEEAAPTLRGLAAVAQVSLGTVYQYFENMYAVRAEVGRQASQLVRATLESEVPEQLADDPERFFATLIARIDGLQRAHPELGCMVRTRSGSGFAEELGSELRTIVEAHVRHSFSGRVADDDLPGSMRVDMALAVGIALLGRAPERRSSIRAAYLQRVTQVAAATLRSEFPGPAGINVSHEAVAAASDE